MEAHEMTLFGWFTPSPLSSFARVFTRELQCREPTSESPRCFLNLVKASCGTEYEFIVTSRGGVDLLHDRRAHPLRGVCCNRAAGARAHRATEPVPLTRRYAIEPHRGTLGGGQIRLVFHRGALSPKSTGL